VAGDWIKMQIDLADKPKVIALAGRLNLDIDSIVGKLHRLWGWADRQTTDGNAPGVTPAFIDSRMGVTGFADALEAIGWLQVSETGIRLVRFEEHNGKTAKTRALTSVRVANHKRNGNGKVTASALPDALPREEKRREEEKITSAPPKDARKPRPEDPLFEVVAEVCGIDWNVCTKDQRGELNQTVGILRERNHTPAEVKTIEGRWYQQDWRGKKGQRPTPSQLRDFWGGGASGQKSARKAEIPG